jgi:hypothetical protein
MADHGARPKPTDNRAQRKSVVDANVERIVADP